jgi:hypothetical protein
MRATIASAKNPHAILYLLRHSIIAHHCARVAQPAAFPLDDVAPQRVASVRNQFSSGLVRGSPGAVVLAQGRERSLERAAGTPKRRGLLLRDLIIERVGDGRRTAAEGDHFQAAK